MVCGTHTTRVEQTVVMTHHQMTLNLRQRVDDHTDENQQRGSSEELREAILHIEK